MSQEENQFADEQAVIETTFRTAWGSTTKVKYENQAWDQPEKDAWVAFTINTGNADAIGLARQIELRQKPLHRYGGQVIVQVFQKERTGTAAAAKLAGKVAGIFRTKTLCKGESGLIRFRTPAIIRIGTKNGWYQLNVFCPYFRDNYHAQQ